MEILVTIYGPDSDDVRLDEAAMLLRAELLELEVDQVRPVSNGGAPAGARAVDPAAVGAVLVVMKESVSLAALVVDTVRSWLRHDPQGQEVEVSVGNRTLRLSNATPEQQQRLIDEFVREITEG